MASARAGAAPTPPIFGRPSARTEAREMAAPLFRARGIAGVVVATIAPYLVACHGVQSSPAADRGRATAPRSGHKDAEYSIAGRPVRLVAGTAETPAAPGSAARI